MAAASFHIFSKFMQQTLDGAVNFGSDTLKVLLLSAYTPSYNTHKFVSDVTGAGTETTGTGYSRQTLTSTSFSLSSDVLTFTCANPSWTTSTFSSAYAVFYDSVGGSDAADLIFVGWDFGGTVSVVAGTFTLSISGSGLMTATGTG
jgi:hypothetical protein